MAEEKEKKDNKKPLLFREYLKLNFKQLRDDRADAVAEDVECIFKRKIEDLSRSIKNYDRDRNNLILDLCPTSAGVSTVVPSDFDPEVFIEKDLELGRSKRDALISLRLLRDRYATMFGELNDGGMADKLLETNNF